MKKILTFLALVALTGSLSAQTPKDVRYVFTEASDLNLIGKIHKETPNPYHRVDTVKYKGFTKSENFQVRCPAGLAVLFKTNKSLKENLRIVGILYFAAAMIGFFLMLFGVN